MSEQTTALSAAAQRFVDQGFAVAVPTRQGYGRLQRAVNDMVSSFDRMGYFATARQTALVRYRKIAVS